MIKEIYHATFMVKKVAAYANEQRNIVAVGKADQALRFDFAFKVHFTPRFFI